MPNKVQKTKADMDAGIMGKEITVFGSLLESDLPADEKSVPRLTDEATALLAAGTETVSWGLTVITYHLLAKPQLLNRLKKELSDAVGDSEQLPAWSALEKLPYLGAVVYEGLRLSYGVSGRTSRIATEEDLIYSGDWARSEGGDPETVQYVIPSGYAIGMSSAIIHHQEDIFPDSHEFIPERWLDEKLQRRKDLERALLTFSKGSRSCIGMK